MIEFSGTLSKNCKKYIIKRARKISLIGSSLVSFIFLIPSIILTCNNLIYLMFVIVLIMFPLFSFFPLSDKSLQYLIPEKIEISNDIIISKGKKYEFAREISSVKKIIDFGDWYHIFFIYPDRSENFICQKSLIVKGTIEEFETMFEDKIVRK